MGTHPIFESDFDCLTEWKQLPCPITMTQRLYYNTGNSQNVEKRTRSKVCVGECDLGNAPPDSLQSRFRYFKRRDPEPDFSSLQRPKFSTYSRAPSNVDASIDETLFDVCGASFESTSTGFLV